MDPQSGGGDARAPSEFWVPVDSTLQIQRSDGLAECALYKYALYELGSYLCI